MRFKFQSRGLIRTHWRVKLNLCGTMVVYQFNAPGLLHQTTLQEMLDQKPDPAAARFESLARHESDYRERLFKRLHNPIQGLDVHVEIHVDIPNPENATASRTPENWVFVGMGQPGIQPIDCNTIGVVVTKAPAGIDVQQTSKIETPQALVEVTLTKDYFYRW